MPATITQKSDNQLLVSGELKFPVIVELRKQAEALLAKMDGSAAVCFSQVTAVDSSALSFWLCCQRFAAEKALNLTAQEVPEDMLQFATLVGLEQSFNGSA